MFRRLSLAAALAASLAMPVHAERQLTLTLTPRNAQEADLMRLGLGLYALRQDLRNGASVDQRGTGNLARFAQSGGGNLGLIRQRGAGHDAGLSQSGGGNAMAILQSGRGTRALVNQRGGEIGIVIQHGF